MTHRDHHREHWRPGKAPRAARLVPFVVLLWAATAVAADWATLGTDTEGNTYAIDESRITRDADTVTLDVRTEYAKPRRIATSDKDIFVALDRIVVDCARGAFAVQVRSFVAADGTEVPSGATARENLRFRTAAAGSMSEKIVQRACGPAKAAR